MTEIELMCTGLERYAPDLTKIARAIKGGPLVPVHGDLQKQNILVCEGKLGLVDFEHFLLAPKELEICNSLFFNDGNCLNLKLLLEFLPNRFFNQRLLKDMLRFYGIKQVFLGMKEDVMDKRLQGAYDRMQELFKRNERKMRFDSSLGRILTI